MDAVDFVKNYIRMCAKYDDCEQCPCYKTVFCEVAPKIRSPESAKEVVKRVEEWAAAYPVKTRQDVFLEQYPEAKINNDGSLAVYPCTVSAVHRDKYGCCAMSGISCHDCQREFWMQEVE